MHNGKQFCPKYIDPKNVKYERECLEIDYKLKKPEE
jgi:hypothetical protein